MVRRKYIGVEALFMYTQVHSSVAVLIGSCFTNLDLFTAALRIALLPCQRSICGCRIGVSLLMRSFCLQYQSEAAILQCRTTTMNNLVSHIVRH